MSANRAVTPEAQERLALALEEAAVRVRQSIPAEVEMDVADHVDRINVGIAGVDAWVPGMRSPLRRNFLVEW